MLHPIKAGILVTSMGVLLFGIYHWFLIAPVPAVFLEGVVWALLVGTVVGWAYERSMLDRGRGGPWWGLAFGALFASTLIPSEIVGLVWGPFPEVTSPGDVVPLLPLGFLGVPLALLIAWFLADRRAVAWPFVVAVTLGHFMIGGSIATFGGRGGVAVLFVTFVAAELVAGLVLGWLAGPALGDTLDAAQDGTGAADAS